MSYATRDSTMTTTTIITKRTSWNSYNSDDTKGKERKIGNFLVSFLVDARGGMLRGTRHPDLKVIIPPKACDGPTRITCRLARRQNITRSSAAMSAGIPLYEAEGKAARLIEVGQSGTGFLDKLHLPSKLPAFLEGEHLASRILQLGTKSDSFKGPLAIEIPHFGNTRGGQREVIIIRSNDGENWTEHKQICTDEEFCKKWGQEDLETVEELTKRRVVRVITNDFPKFFALVSRAKEDSCQVGPRGGVLTSSIHSGARSTFPEGALKKEIQVGIQVQSIPEGVCKRAVGTKARASPIVTIEPRRRKFHKPIVLTIPLPEGSNMKEYLSSTEDPTLRLLCSITGGTDPAQWEDITGTTPLTFQEDCVSFTTTVSAKFWLIDCPHSSESSELAKRIYAEVVRVPYMGQFAVYARTNDSTHADVKVYCTTDDRLDRTLEAQEGFVEVARSKDIDVTDDMSVYLELSGNVSSISKTQHSCSFIPFADNTIKLAVKIRDATQDPIGRFTFYRDPKGSKVHGARKPICSLNVTLPPCEKTQSVDSTPTRLSSDITSAEAKQRYYLIDPSSGNDSLRRVSAKIGLQWKQLAAELGMSNEEIWKVDKEMMNADPGEKSFLMLFRWEDTQRDKDRDQNDATLREALRKIGREDILDEPHREPHDHHDQSGFSALDAELGPSQETPMHVSSPFPFSPKHNSTIKEEEPSKPETTDKSAPIYSHVSDEYDDPNKPHFVYVESTSSVNESDLPSTKPDEKSEDAVFQSNETNNNTAHDLAAQLMEDQLQQDMDISSEPQVVNMQSEVEFAAREQQEEESSGEEEEIRTTIKRTIVVDEEDLNELNLPPTVVEVTNTEHGTVHVTREVKQTIVEQEIDNTSSSSSESD